jgi:hypothetical protein
VSAAARRYALTVAGARQRLTAPILVMVLATAVLQVSGGGLRPTSAVACGYLFPLAAWLTVALVGADPAPTAAIVAVGARGTRALRRAQCRAALEVSAAGAALAYAGAVLSNLPHLALDDAIASALALALTVVGGVVLGSLCAPPVMARPGWSLSAVAVVSVAEVLVPVVPPVGPAIRGLGPETGGVAWWWLGGAVVGTAVLSAALLAVEKVLLQRLE